MKIKKYICPGCGKEHEKRICANKSEGIAYIFTQECFPILWEQMKHKAAQMPLEEFCKELAMLAVYNYHRNSRRFRLGKDDIIADGSTENSSPET